MGPTIRLDICYKLQNIWLAWQYTILPVPITCDRIKLRVLQIYHGSPDHVCKINLYLFVHMVRNAGESCVNDSSVRVFVNFSPRSYDLRVQSKVFDNTRYLRELKLTKSPCLDSLPAQSPPG